MATAMKKIFNYTINVLMAVALLTSCSDVMQIDEPQLPTVDDGAIVMEFTADGADVTRADDMADSAAEYALNTLDIMIFTDGETDAEKVLDYHQRVMATGPSGKVALGKSRDKFEVGKQYWVYVVANSSADEAVFAQIGDVKALKDLVQEDKNIHLTGVSDLAPSHFLMDGVAYSGATEQQAAVVLNDGDKNVRTTKISVTLRRAAVKVVVKLIAGNDVEFTDKIAGSTAGYYLRNMPYATQVIAPNTLLAQSQLTTTTETNSNHFNWMRNDAGKITGVVITAYFYAHKWETNNAFTQATNLIVDIPIIYSEEKDGAVVATEHESNYYQIPMSRNFTFERNHYYEVTANVNAPGADDVSEPIELEDLKYSAEPWIETSIEVGGEVGPTYLKVNQNEMKIYNSNIDSETLVFASSSPVTITVKDVYYIDKFGVQQNISASTYHISGSTDNGAISGNITVKSDEPTNNTIRYFTLVVTNQTGEVEEIKVEQYPLVYVVNKLGHYSYRDDFYATDSNGIKDLDDENRPSTYEYAGDLIRRVGLNRWDSTTKTWSYTYSSSEQNTNSGYFWYSKVNRETYEGSRYSADQIGRSNIDYYYWDEVTNRQNVGTMWNPEWVETTTYELGYSGAQDPGNARMYHVRITSSSEHYKLGVPRQTTSSNLSYSYTDPGEDNAELVSPSFMIASRLGFVNTGSSSTLSKATTEEQRLALFRDHCANYVEVAQDGTVYDDWRLPTEAELNIIIGLQGTANKSADAIDYLLNAVYYYAANGRVFNPGNDDRVTSAPATTSSWSVRCVRDEYRK